MFHILLKVKVNRYFKTELIKPISPLYFNDKERTSALISVCSLLNILLPDSQPNREIYESFEKLINSINLENWIFLYILFEINLIKELGYDTNLIEHLKHVDANRDFLRIKIDGYIYEIPNYLIIKEIPKNFTNLIIRKSLYFTRQVMLNKFFIQIIYFFLNHVLFLKII